MHDDLHIHIDVCSGKHHQMAFSCRPAAPLTVGSTEYSRTIYPLAEKFMYNRKKNKIARFQILMHAVPLCMNYSVKNRV